jgi:hypothetical protein
MNQPDEQPEASVRVGRRGDAVDVDRRVGERRRIGPGHAAREFDPARIDGDRHALRRIAAAAIECDQRGRVPSGEVGKRPLGIRIRRGAEGSVADTPQVLDRVAVTVGVARVKLHRTACRCGSHPDAARDRRGADVHGSDLAQHHLDRRQVDLLLHRSARHGPGEVALLADPDGDEAANDRAVNGRGPGDRWLLRNRRHRGAARP